jgi:hypothetical protein
VIEVRYSLKNNFLTVDKFLLSHQKEPFWTRFLRCRRMKVHRHREQGWEISSECASERRQMGSGVRNIAGTFILLKLGVPPLQRKTNEIWRHHLPRI